MYVLYIVTERNGVSLVHRMLHVQEDLLHPYNHRKP